jgi:hypothetical protein
MLPNWQNFPVIPNVREMHQLPLISVDACLIFSHRLPQPHRPQQSWTMNTDWVTVSFSKAYLDAKERQRVSFASRLWLHFPALYLQPSTLPIVDRVSALHGTNAVSFQCLCAIVMAPIETGLTAPSTISLQG